MGVFGEGELIDGEAVIAVELVCRHHANGWGDE